MEQDYLKILEELANELNKQEQATSQPQNTSQQSQEQYQAPSQNLTEEDLEAKLKYYKEIGTQRFIAKNASMPDFSKLFPYIVQYAEALFYDDIQNGRQLKDDYYDYLEQGKLTFFKELTNITKNTIDYIKQTHTPSHQTNQSTTPEDTMKDYYNEYKKMLIKSTAEKTPMEFKDGYINEKGRVVAIAEGELPIDKKAELSEF